MGRRGQDRMLYGGIAGFLVGEILTMSPFVWPELSDAMWAGVVWGGTCMMAVSSCALVVVTAASARIQRSK